MVLDDEPIVCKRLQNHLQKKGFSVETFITGQEAMDRLAQHHFHILITDLKMSGAEGIEVIRFAGKHSHRIKTIVISGFATNETADEAFKAGAVEFIAKPFKLSQIRKLVEQLAAEIRLENKL
ncbi:MAG TPA: response regulator [Bacteroidetes bacterium]|nr:response regulator [Bacteroidota bacterium]